jgi:2-succinyl-6-hydroxy-2,4-cyclohexadiene-1-carboxylate synthase
MIDHPGPLHHVIEGPIHPPTPGTLAPPTPGTPGPPAPGTPDPPAPGTPDPPAPGTALPPGPVPGPPVGERNPAGEGAPTVVHNPPNPHREREQPVVHSPSSPRREREQPPGHNLPNPYPEREQPPGHNPPNLRRERVVLVHGFTQTLASWGVVGERLAGRFEVVRVDLPGHGGSGGVRVGFEEAAGLVGEAGGVGAYVGYSLGGRLCLRLALDRPDLVPALVLIGASPGIGDPGGRVERREADEALARRVERDGVAAFLDGWLAGPLFASLPEEVAGREERLANTAEGLAYALRRLGTGTQEPLWDRLGGLAPPVLLVAGEHDVKFPGIARKMAAAIGPSAEVALVPGAGHAVHLERPAATAALVEEFLAARLR